LEYLGREDDQVKVRGYRIELGEIESVLRECPGVRDAAVVVREATPNDKRLVAYVVGEAEAAELREQLHARLPNYMLPTGWVKLDRLPLSANGKVNRAALPRPEPAAETAEAELTVVEELVAGIWEDVLGCGRAGRYDNFFALGGHSLLATQVVSRIRTAFEIEITIKDLFESPRLRDFACLIERRRRAGARVEVPPIGVVGRVGPLPVSFAQQRLWFMDQLHPGDFAYNVPFALRLRGHLQLDVLTQTFQTIVRRHEAVRTRFISCEGIPFQIIEPGDNFRVARTDLSALRPEDRERALTDISRLEARQPFDLGQAPLLRAIVARVDETDHVLFCTLHHIVSDAWSARILARELAELYSCHVGRRRPNLPDLPVQYADYAVWQRKWLHGAVLERHLDYWRQQLRGPLPTINLTTDGKASGARSAPARQYTTHLAADLTQAVKVLCRQEEVTLFMFFLAVFTLWLSRETRQKDIIVATSVGNRDRTETEGLIAFFVNLLLLRTDLSGNPSFRELLARVRAATLGALAHQELPFERIVEDLRLQHHGGRPAVERVLLMVQRSEAESAGLPGLSVERLPEPAKKTKWDLALFIAEQADELTATWRYRMDLFKPGTVARVSDGFEEILGRVIGNPNGAVEDLTAPAEREKTRMELEYEEFAESALHSFRATRVEGVPVMPGVAGWGGLEI
jgi:hypothetical protein